MEKRWKETEETPEIESEGGDGDEIRVWGEEQIRGCRGSV